MPARSLMLVQETAEHHEGRGTDRQIDPENERPTDVLDEEGAECRADDRSDTPDAGYVALHAGALGRPINVADDGRGNRLNGPPCSARNMIRGTMPQASPHSVEPSRKRLAPAKNTRLRP